MNPLRIVADEPLVTIITPTYNRREFLPETIGSVLSQDYPRIEHLVLDDGSTDDTASLLEQFAVKEPGRFRWTQHPNVGQPRTINRGFELAHGELCCILNSDDTLLEHAISSLVAELLSDDDALGVYPDFQVVDREGKAIAELVMPPYSFVDMVRTQNNFLGPGVVFTTALARKLGGWDPSYRIIPDLDFWIRGGLLGTFRHLPKTLATWRQHSGSITVADQDLEVIEERFRFVESFFSIADLPSEIRAVKNEAYRNLYFIAGITMLPEFNRKDDRFVVFDRLSWSIDANAKDTSVEMTLLAEREHSGRLQVIVNQQAEVIEALNQGLKLERAHSSHLQVVLDEQARAIEQLQRRPG